MGLPINPNTRLSESEKRAMLAVWAGHNPHHTITTALHFLDMHMPRNLLLPALEYLQRQRLTGKRLHDFIVGDCANRYLVFQQKLTEAIYKQPGLVLISGKKLK